MTGTAAPPRPSGPVAIVGMGRVGLPLAIGFASRGLRVMGIERDDARRRPIELGTMPFQEAGADELLKEQIASGRLTVHADPAEVIPQVESVVLCVATPLGADLRADYAQLRRALDQLVPHLRAGQLVVLRSTVSPGTLLKVLVPYVREHAPEVAPELRFAACPERIAEGHAMVELFALPEIIGGIDEQSTEAAACLFAALGADKPIQRTDPTSAELAKLFTNVYRYVNFALANEFALLAEQYRVDARAVLRMANHAYPRTAIPLPGPAGGPCLSKDGYFLVEEFTLPDFVLLAWKLNDSMPVHAVRRLSRRLAMRGVELDGAEVAVLGRAFKRDSDDDRQSPAVRVADVLLREGAEVRVHDPFFAGPTLDQALDGAVALVLATNHSAYDSLDPGAVAERLDPPRVAMDCWGVLDRGAFEAAGIELLTFGVGEPD